jgi:N-acyl-D-amino-acid deacylase
MGGNIMNTYDLVIRNGRVIDGSGAPAFVADVAVKDGVIVAVGEISGSGAEEIDATGKIVTPGFVDIHTHYDGQVTWEQTLAPSSSHGVTTVITGNCGVGFAPCRPDDRDKLVKVMEGVEDIPEVVMAEGLPWNWETFPEYLDAVGRRRLDIDVALQIAHSPIRVYVMGDRGVRREPSTAEDRAAMRRLVAEAVRAGAVGVSTSRALHHRARDGSPAPSVSSADEELLALAEGLREAGAGVFQLITETNNPPAQEAALVQRLAEASGRPVSFTLTQTHTVPENWREMAAGIARARAAGLPVRGQVADRPVGLLMGLELSMHPVWLMPGYLEIAHLPLAERVAVMSRPEVKARILGEEPTLDPVPLNNRYHTMAGEMFELGDPPDYAPPPQMRLSERAKALGVTALSLAYDILLKDGGRGLLYFPAANYGHGDMRASREMMALPDTVVALGDGGAHYGMICDASYSTYLLTYWTRDAPAELRFPLEWAVASLTRRPAEAVGLLDRGLVRQGGKADLNVIDYDRLRLHAPHPVYNLPAGGRRLQQRADGYVATVVSGEVTYREGRPTGALPGRLVRGQQAG